MSGDYAKYDLTQLRLRPSESRLCDGHYVRHDGTLTFFFTKGNDEERRQQPQPSAFAHRKSIKRQEECHCVSSVSTLRKYKNRMGPSFCGCEARFFFSLLICFLLFMPVFAAEQLVLLLRTAGFSVLECRYHRKTVINRKKQVAMNRVWLQAVCIRPSFSSAPSSAVDSIASACSPPVAVAEIVRGSANSTDPPMLFALPAPFTPTSLM